MFYANSADKNLIFWTTQFPVFFVNLFLGFLFPYVFALETAQSAFEACYSDKYFRYDHAELNLNKMTSCPDVVQTIGDVSCLMQSALQVIGIIPNKQFASGSEMPEHHFRLVGEIRV